MPRFRRVVPACAALLVGLVGLGSGTPVSTPAHAAPVALPHATAAPAGSTLPFVSRVVVGRWASLLDATGTLWKLRSGVIGPAAASTRLVGSDVKRTTNDALYQVSATKLTGYTLAVPRPGRYAIRLLMAEGYFTTPGARVFDVSAEGSTVLRDVDILKQAGFATAYDRTFEVEVTDGRLDLGFTASANVPMIAAIEVTDALAQATPAGERAVQFAPDSFWYAEVRAAPLAGNTAAVAANLAEQVRSRYNGVAGFNVWQYNLTMYRVRPGSSRTDVGFWDCQNQAYVEPYLTTGSGPFVGVPVPADAVGATGTDSSVSIYDPATDQLWELWKFRQNPTTGAYEACWGGRIDRASDNPGYHQGTFGVSAAGVAMTPGMITLDDVRRGEINHAMYLAVPRSRGSSVFSWPAQRSDGWGADLDLVMQGQRVRLDPSVDVDALDLTPIGRMVAMAAQRYGFVVADTAGAVSVATESGLPLKRATGEDPWSSLLGTLPSYEVLRNFPWASTQVVERDYGRP